MSGMLPPDLYQQVVTQAPDAILYADTAGIVRMWNRGAERIFGVPAGDAVGRSLDLIIPERLRERHWQGWRQVMQTGKSRYGEAMLRVPALRSDGTQFSSEFCIVMITKASGEVQGIAAILRDVTAQWEQAQAMQRKIRALSSAAGAEGPAA